MTARIVVVAEGAEAEEVSESLCVSIPILSKLRPPKALK